MRRGLLTGQGRHRKSGAYTTHCKKKEKKRLGPMYDVYLRLSRPRVPQEQHVDVPPDAVFGVYVLCASAKKAQRDRSFHVLAAVDRRRNGADDAPSDLSFDCVRPCDRGMQGNTWSNPNRAPTYDMWRGHSRAHSVSRRSAPSGT